MTLVIAAVFAAALSIAPVPQSAELGHSWTKRLAELIMLNDTDSEVSETVSAKGLSAVGKDIFSGAAYDFSSGSCRVVLPPRESAFVLFAE